jgi:hypothetical protein
LGKGGKASIGSLALEILAKEKQKRLSDPTKMIQSELSKLEDLSDNQDMFQL